MKINIKPGIQCADAGPRYTWLFCFHMDPEAHMLPYRFCTKQSRLTLIVPTFSKKGILQIIRGASI